MGTVPPMPRRRLILLPPSEGKAPEGSGPPWAPATLAVGQLDPQRRRVLRALGAAHPVRRAPTLPARQRYTGVLYRELDPASLPAAARRRLDAQVLIVSGLWGLVAPEDPIPDYRLKMSARLDPLGRLSTWWRPAITTALAPRVAGATVWDLLPNEHVAAVDWSQLEPAERITARFIDASGRTVSHWNKLLKGSLVRWLLLHPGAGVDDLVGLDHPQGYRYDPASTERQGATTAITFRAG